MSTLTKGARVQICPYPSVSWKAYPDLAEYDGCAATVLSVSGDKREAHVEVVSPGRGGEIDVPVRALKALDD